MNDLPPPATNIPEYSVSEVSGAVKRTLEGAFGRIRVRGEISEFKRSPLRPHVFLPQGRGRQSSARWCGAAARHGSASSPRTGWR